MKPLLILAIVLLSCGSNSKKQNPAKLPGALTQSADTGCVVNQFPKWKGGHGDSVQVHILYSDVTKKYVIQVTGFVWPELLGYRSTSYPTYWNEALWQKYQNVAADNIDNKRRYLKGAFVFELNQADKFDNPCVANQVAEEVNRTFKWADGDLQRIYEEETARDRTSDSLKQIDQSYKPVK